MKTLIIFSIMLCAIGFTECISPEMRTKMMRMMVEKCGAKEGANQEEIETTIAKKSPTTQAGKCIQACLAETANMLGTDLKLNVEKTIQLAGMAFDFDPNVIEATRLMADACKDVTGPERCAAIYNIFECAQRVAIEKKLPETMMV